MQYFNLGGLAPLPPWCSDARSGGVSASGDEGGASGTGDESEAVFCIFCFESCFVAWLASAVLIARPIPMPPATRRHRTHNTTQAIVISFITDPCVSGLLDVALDVSSPVDVSSRPVRRFRRAPIVCRDDTS